MTPIDPNREYTKKEIAELFGLSPNTVYNTLLACGLSTSQRAYLGQELLERFIPARQMFEAGGTTEDVQRHFGLKDASVGTNQAPTTEKYEEEGIGFADAVTQEVASSVRAIVVAGVTDLIPHLPKMAAAALEEIARTGAIREAFARHRNDYLTMRSPLSYESPVLNAGVEAIDETDKHADALVDHGDDGERADAWSSYEQ